MNAIEIKNLSKNYDLIKAVKNISLEIKDGELFGLFGVNGAGKTTIIKMLSGLVIPSSGDALIYGKSIVNNLEETKNYINVLLENGDFNSLKTVTLVKKQNNWMIGE